MVLSKRWEYLVSANSPHQQIITSACCEESVPTHSEPPFEFAGILGPPPDGKSLVEYLEEIDRTPMVRRLYYYWPGKDDYGNPLSIEDVRRIPDQKGEDSGC